MLPFTSSAALCFCLLAIAGPSAPLGVEAASLRALAPRSHSTPPNTNESPADMEEEEEDETSDESLPSSPPVAMEAPPAQPQAALSELLQQTVPSDPSAMLPRSQEPVFNEAYGGQQAQSQDVAVQQAVASDQSQVPPVFYIAASQEAVPAVTATEQQQAATPVSDQPQASETPSKSAAPQLSEQRAPSASIPKVSQMSKVPMWVAKKRAQEASFQSKPANWPPADNGYQQCDPPCIQGRGICNDNVCFCKSPFTGSTCQHRISALYRAPRIMVVGFATVCFLLGILVAKLLMELLGAAAETRMQKFGEKKDPKKETWKPPEGDKKRSAS